jgi:hypothetical protein
MAVHVSSQAPCGPHARHRSEEVSLPVGQSAGSIQHAPTVLAEQSGPPGKSRAHDVPTTGQSEASDMTHVAAPVVHSPSVAAATPL